MQVRLLNYTPKPVETVYTAARTCYSDLEPSGIWSRRVSYVEMVKLLDKTIASGHHSVLEHISFTFSIEGISRSCSHQLVRHRLASFSQQSQRYISMTDAEYVIPPTINFNPKAKEIFQRLIADCNKAYDDLIEIGISQEDARFVMPNAAATSLVATMNFRELWHVAGIRLCQRAQWEIRELFQKIKSEMHSVPELTGLAQYLEPRCVQIGYCPEYKGCGYYKSKEESIENDKIQR